MKENEIKNPLIYIDEKIQTPQIKALKAAIPYMEPSVGKAAAVMLKLFEAKIIMDTFENGVTPQMSSEIRVRRMLEAVRPYLGAQSAETAENLVKMLEMRSFAQMMSAANEMANNWEGDR